MKSFFLLLPVLLAAGLASAQQVTETPVTIGLNEGGNPQGYIQGANDQGIFFSTSPGGTARPIAYSQIRGEGLDKAIRFEERVEVLGEPRALFASGRYEEAAAAYGQVARSYAIILKIPQNFALEAFFYEAESLRRARNYEQLAEVMALPVAATIETLLGERYQQAYTFQKLWGLFGAGNMSELETELAAYQEPVIGDAKLLSSANFKKMPGAQVAQIAYLRGKVLEAKGEKGPALDDFYRSFTIGYGNDPGLARAAMLDAMKLQQEDPAFSKEGSDVESQVQALAYLYSKRFGSEGLDPALEKLAVRPAMAAIAPPAPAEKSAPADSEEGGDGEAPKEGEKADDEGGEAKGKAQGKAQSE